MARTTWSLPWPLLCPRGQNQARPGGCCEALAPPWSHLPLQPMRSMELILGTLVLLGSTLMTRPLKTLSSCSIAAWAERWVVSSMQL